MKIIFGDLIQLAKIGKFDIIIHGCNCFCTMGAGIAVSIKRNFPEAYDADCKTVKGDKSKLGNYTQAEIQRNGIVFSVINAYTQYKYGFTKDINTDYNAIDSVFKKIKEDFISKDLRIAYPQIGCGLGGGDWNIVSDIINRNLEGMNHTLVMYKRGK